MTLEHESAAVEPHHSSSPTDHVLTELQLYGWRPFEDEPDPRPLPEGNQVAAAVTDIVDALVATLGDIRTFLTGCIKRPTSWLASLPRHTQAL